MTSTLGRTIYFVLLALLTSGRFATATAIFPTVVISDLELTPSNAPQVGSLEVSLQSSSPTSIPIAGFQLELNLTGPDNAVRFTGVLPPQAHPYLFAGNSTGPLFSVSADGRQLTIGDFLNAGFGNIVTDIGLATIQVLVEVAAAGKSYGVEISADPIVSYLAIDSRTVIPFAIQNASIRLVPEPAAIVVCLVLAAGGMATRLRRGTRSRSRIL